MSELEHARKRLKAISEGHYAPKAISIAEAKKQLYAADPSIDISGFLKALHQNNKQKAATSLLLETLADPSVIAYWSPVLIGLIQTLMPADKPAAAKESVDA